MSNRQAIIDALAINAPATVPEIAQQLSWTERKVRDTLSDLSKNEIVTRKRDDVTNLSCYSLTAKGKAQARTQAGSGVKTLADAHRKPAVGGSPHAADNPAEGASVESPPQPYPPTAEAGDNENSPPPSDQACCNAARVVATTAADEVTRLRRQIQLLTDTSNAASQRAAAAEESLSKWLEICWLNGIESPEALAKALSPICKSTDGPLPGELITTTAPELLTRAANIMAERAKQYDQPHGERSMGKCVMAFNIVSGRNDAADRINEVLTHLHLMNEFSLQPPKVKETISFITRTLAGIKSDLSESEGWLFMQILKDIRQWQNPGRYHADSAEDCIAYAALKAESLCREAFDA